MIDVLLWIALGPVLVMLAVIVTTIIYAVRS